MTLMVGEESEDIALPLVEEAIDRYLDSGQTGGLSQSVSIVALQRWRRAQRSAVDSTERQHATGKLQTPTNPVQNHLAEPTQAGTLPASIEPPMA